MSSQIGRLLQIVVDAAELNWMDQARCGEIGGDEWFPEKGGSTAQAKAICRACEVRAECLEYALEHHEHWGIWGGLSGPQRRRLQRRSEGRAA
jgi:WhiB family transcriptional regulator, redox-sensing transcriptional regulator